MTRLPGQGPDDLGEVDDLLRATLADEPRPEVAARLEQRVERFVLERRSRADHPLAALGRVRLAAGSWLAARAVRVAASAALVACGVVLHAVGRPPAVAASVTRVNQQVSLWDAIRRATGMACTAPAQDDLGSPSRLADRVFRDWVLEGPVQDQPGRLAILAFRAPVEGARYRLVIDSRSGLPTRVTKTWLPGAHPPPGLAAGYDARCSWYAPAGGPGLPLRDAGGVARELDGDWRQAAEGTSR